MTDNEIIKALELHAMDDDNTCDDCDYRACGCSYTLCKDAIDLINRLQQENKNYNQNIEQLTSDHRLLQNDYEHIKRLFADEKLKVEKANQKLIDICKALKTAKSEAIKEVLDEIAERLHEAEMHGNYEPSLNIEIINDIKRKIGAANG